MKKRQWFIAALVLELVLGGHVHAQSSTILGYGFTAPILALPGQTISVCTLDWFTGPIPAGPVTITQQIVDVAINGAIYQKSVTLPISPYDPYHNIPCIVYTVPAGTTSPAGAGELFVGAVTLYPVAGTASGTPAPLLSASVNVAGATSVQTTPIPMTAVSSLAAFRQSRP